MLDPFILITLFVSIAVLLLAAWLLLRQLKKQRAYPELSEGIIIDGIPGEASSLPAYELDIESGRMFWNDAFYNTFGYKLSEPAGSLEWWTNHIHPKDTLALTNTMDKLSDTESAGWTTRYRFRKADGSYVQVRDEAYIRRAENGKAIHLTGSLNIVRKK